MAEMALGYGSEYQLLRFLGHHRNYLNKKIQELLNTSEEILWCDYPSNVDRKSLDGEFTGIDCFSVLPNYTDLQNKWHKYWPAKTEPSWDGIFRVGDKWFFVEAKAHEKECYSKSEKSRRSLITSFDRACLYYKSSKKGSDWVSGDCSSYQLANRLAFSFFCKENNIDGNILYISFSNGYKQSDDKDDSVKNAEDWEKIWKEEFKELGLDYNNISDVWHNLCIDCSEKLSNVF